MADDSDLGRAQARIGTTLRGKYRLDAVLGMGGMAVVYAATHRNQAEFAIKVLHPELSLREDVRTRFLREGYAANSVKHPGVAQVVDDDVAEDGAAFLVMELLRGQSVEALWESSGGRLPVASAALIVDQLLDVLSAAHARSIIHRDIKPANLFVLHDGTVKVLDFGIARARDAAMGNSGDGKGTGTGMLLGTPAFMAPEQAMAKSSEIDAQTDVWAAAATFFSLVTGQLVHPGENAAQLLIFAATSHARPLASVAPHVPPGIARVIDQGMAFDKSLRWPSAAAMREALRDATRAAYGVLPERVPLASLTSDLTAGVAATQAPGIVITPVPPAPPRASFPGAGPMTPAAAMTPPPHVPTFAPMPVATAFRYPGGTTSQPVGSPTAPPEPIVIAKHSTAVPIVVGTTALVALVAAAGLGLRSMAGGAPASSSAGPGASLSVPSAPSAQSAPSTVASQTPGRPAGSASEAGAAAAATHHGPTLPPPPAVLPATASPGLVPVAPALPVAPARPVPPAVNCTPPFYFDSQGNRVFKKECL